MDRALLGGEPLTVLSLSISSWFFNLEFQVLQEFCRKVASLYVISVTLLQMCLRLLATLWQICSKELEGIGNPLAIIF
jgi:hypothetical protein